MNGELDDAVADDDGQESSSPDTLFDVLTDIAYSGVNALNSKRIQRDD